MYDITEKMNFDIPLMTSRKNFEIRTVLYENGMTTLAGGCLVTNYHDEGRKVSKSNLDRVRKQKRPLRQTAVDTWRG